MKEIPIRPTVVEILEIAREILEANSILADILEKEIIGHYANLHLKDTLAAYAGKEQEVKQ